MGNIPLVSVICPIYKEAKFIGRCIQSVLDQDYPSDRLEVFYVDGMSEDGTREIVRHYSDQYEFINLLDNPQRVVPTAMNIGVLASHGDIIIRLDAHAIYPQYYFSSLVKHLIELDAANVGGICVTLPAKDTSLCRAIAIAISTKFGVGNSYFRIGVNKIIEVDTVPFGCFPRKVFDQVGYYDVDLIRNQDDEFNGRIIKNGGKIFLIPELKIDYFARETVAKMAKMFYQYGLFKPLVNKKLGRPATIRQFFPALFVLGIIVGGVLSFLSNLILIMYLSVIIIYLSLSFYFGAVNALKNKDYKILFLMPLIFFVIHMSYGWGYLRGITRFIIGGKNRVAVNVNR